MGDPRLGRRYADALYEVAMKGNEVEDVFDALRQISEAFENIPELDKFWRAYNVSATRKKALVKEAFAEAPESVRNLLFFLADRKRETVLFDVFTAFNDRHDAELGIIRAMLTTAIELDEKETVPFVELLKNRFGGKIKMKRRVDPSLIAGFRLRYGNRIIDASVERSIDELRRIMSA